MERCVYVFFPFYFWFVYLLFFFVIVSSLLFSLLFFSSQKAECYKGTTQLVKLMKRFLVGA